MKYTNKNAKGTKGILLKFVVGLMLGLIVLAGLIYTIALVSKTFLGQQEELQAKGLLERIKQLINKTIETKKIQEDLLIILKDWYLVFIPADRNVIDNLKKPSIYFGQDVVCICKNKECKYCFPSKKLQDKDNNFLKIKLDRLYSFSVIDMEEYILFNTNQQEIIYSKPKRKDIDNIKQDIENYEPIVKIVKEEAEENDIDPNLILAIIKMESEFNDTAVSPCGAAGIMQLVPATAMHYGLKVAIKKGEESILFDNFDEYKNYLNSNNLWKKCDKCGEDVVVSPCNACTVFYCDYKNDERFNASKSIQAGIKYLRDLLMEFEGNKYEYAIAAYHDGLDKIKSNCLCQDKVCRLSPSQCFGKTYEYTSTILFYREAFREATIASVA